MQELERQREREKERSQSEREPTREELYAEVDGEPTRRSRRTKPKTGRQRRRQRLIFLLLVAALAAYLFVAHTPYRESTLQWVADLNPLGEQGQATYDEPELQEEQGAPSEQPGEGEEEQGAPSDQPAEEETEKNVYAATTTTEVKESLADVPERVYVPNVMDGTVTVIDPETFEIVDSYKVEGLPFHVTPSWDMSTLYAANEESSTLTAIDIRTGRPSGTVQATFPYNFYYTPDGKKAIVVAERIQTIGIRDAETWELLGSVYIPWPGVDHLDFSEDGSYFLASSEWSGVVSKVDVEKMKLVDYAEVTGALPVDIKLSPDGEVFYVANQDSNGVSVIDPEKMEEIDFIPTGEGAHGLQISRDTKSMYIANRLEGTISVMDLKTRKITDTWVTGGTPDMMQISPDGRQLWVSGRYDGAVYVVDTRTGELLATIFTGAQPHGLTYFPNPGRFSLGHNGVYR
jgi:YVTN family beta-propeller protein